MQLKSGQSPGQSRASTKKSTITVRPKSSDEIVAVLQNRKHFPTPVRPMGANSGNTRCTAVQEGTVMDMTGMNKILQIRSRTVKVQAGMRLRDLARRLDEYGLELVGSYEYPDRTVGGAISSGSMTAGFPEDGAHLAASVCGLTLVTPDGRTIDFDDTTPEMMVVVRQSFGLLGVISNVTLKIRKSCSYSIRNRKIGFAELSTIAPSLARTNTGVKLFMLPFRDRIFIELRDASSSEQKRRSFAWKFREWAVNKILPDIVHSVGKYVPIGRIRDPLIDGFSEATQLIANTRFVDAGSNAVEQTGQFRKVGAESRSRSCTWLFPADKFGAAIYSYREFARRHYETTGYRCDLPAVGYRIPKDRSALLSPSYDGPMFALSLRSTNTSGWDDLMLDFAKISARFDGVPVFNQTRGFTPDQVLAAYGKRLERFRAMRRKLDPQNRLLNQFFAEHVG